MDKLLKKLTKLLKKAGIEEEKVEKILAELEGSEDDPGENPNPDAPTDEEPKEPIPESEKPADEQIPPVPEEGEPVPPTDVPADLPPQEEPPVPPVEETVPPVEEVPPVQPMAPGGVGLEEFQKLVEQVTEKDAVIEALTKRIDSLEESLKAAGIITGEATPQVETPPQAPANEVPTSGGLDDFLSQVNGGSVRF